MPPVLLGLPTDMQGQQMTQDAFSLVREDLWDKYHNLDRTSEHLYRVHIVSNTLDTADLEEVGHIGDPVF
jgi:hypothetical protein